MGFLKWEREILNTYLQQLQLFSTSSSVRMAASRYWYFLLLLRVFRIGLTLTSSNSKHRNSVSCPLFLNSGSIEKIGIWIWAEHLDWDLSSTLHYRPQSPLSNGSGWDYKCSLPHQARYLLFCHSQHHFFSWIARYLFPKLLDVSNLKTFLPVAHQKNAKELLISLIIVFHCVRGFFLRIDLFGWFGFFALLRNLLLITWILLFYRDVRVFNGFWTTPLPFCPFFTLQCSFVYL
jgi:hypothetical protein